MTDDPHDNFLARALWLDRLLDGIENGPPMSLDLADRIAQEGFAQFMTFLASRPAAETAAWLSLPEVRAEMTLLRDVNERNQARLERRRRMQG